MQEHSARAKKINWETPRKEVSLGTFNGPYHGPITIAIDAKATEILLMLQKKVS